MGCWAVTRHPRCIGKPPIPGCGMLGGYPASPRYWGLASPTLVAEPTKCKCWECCVVTQHPAVHGAGMLGGYPASPRYRERLMGCYPASLCPYTVRDHPASGIGKPGMLGGHTASALYKQIGLLGGYPASALYRAFGMLGIPNALYIPASATYSAMVSVDQYRYYYSPAPSCHITFRSAGPRARKDTLLSQTTEC